MVSPVVVFLLVGLLDMISVSLLASYLKNHEQTFGLNDLQIAIAGAVFSGCQIISSPIIGSLGDVKGRKTILLLCLFICSIAYFSLGITSSFIAYIAIRAIIGSFQQVQVLTKALAPDYMEDTNQLAALYGRSLSVSTLGLALGPALSKRITESCPDGSFTVLCAILAALFMVNRSLANLLPENIDKKKEKSENVSKSRTLTASILDTPKQTLNNLYSINWTSYWDILLFKFLMALAMGQYYSNFNLFLDAHHSIEPSSLGYILTFQRIVGSICNNTVVYVNKMYSNDRDYRQRMLHIFLLMTFSLLGLVLAPNVPVYVILIVPKALSFSLAKVVTLQVMVHRSKANNRGTLVGMSNSIEHASEILTPIICGFINHFLGASCAFYGGALFTTIGIILSYTFGSTSIIKEKIK